MPILERYVNFKINNRFDAEDVIQETCLAATGAFAQLKNHALFKAWLIGIAKNKCVDYYRKRSKGSPLSIDALPESMLCIGRCGITEQSAVRTTLEQLGEQDQQILSLYYFKELSQDEIAKRLSLPIGTVKSRLYYARKKFKEKYPYHHSTKGDWMMKKLPETLPDYTIEESALPVFAIRWEEVMGWFIVPKLGEKLGWAMYDFPERIRTESCYMQVVGRAEVHGIEGVEITATEYDPMECNSAGGQSRVERGFVAQLTDTHCRLLSEYHMEGGVKKYYTFLDGDSFLNNWGFGEDNCGNEVVLTPKGDITRKGNQITIKEKDFLLDIVGRYRVTINGKTYDTVCIMDFETYNEGTVSEQFVDQNGKTVLWRRFNRNDWAFHRYGKLWTELLPENERMAVNGATYVHWYDCITDYIL